jgi:hypothetical protein
MKNWLQKNYKTLIVSAFLIPIFTVAIVSISHVTKWYGISNPVTWAVYLSIGIEIAALSTLAAISANLGKKVYFPFAIVTLIQFIGNIYFAYSYIDINSQSFKDWVDLVRPLLEFIGVDSQDMVGHKRFLALFAGGMLPIISLSFLHMLVKFTEEEKKKVKDVEPIIDVEEISKQAGKLEAEIEKQKWVPTEEDLKKLEEVLIKAKKEEDSVQPSETPKNASEMMITKNQDIIDSIPQDDEDTEWDDEIAAWDNTLLDGIEKEPDFYIQELPEITPEPTFEPTPEPTVLIEPTLEPTPEPQIVEEDIITPEQIEIYTEQPIIETQVTQEVEPEKKN